MKLKTSESTSNCQTILNVLIFLKALHNSKCCGVKTNNREEFTVLLIKYFLPGRCYTMDVAHFTGDVCWSCI